MLHDIILALWFMLPVALANATPIFVAVIPGLKQWDAPMDFGRTWRGKPIFGPHKTWRGIISGMIIATLVLWLQCIAFEHTSWARTAAHGVDYGSFPILLLGPLFGIGALGGDAIESFFKRRRGLVAGSRWIPFDQLDYIIGGILVSLPFTTLSIVQYCWIVALWFCMHVVVSYLGWISGLKQHPI